jgi:hypothetical protein
MAHLTTEIEAMKAIADTLDALTDDARNRVISWISSAYGVAPPSNAIPPSPPADARRSQPKRRRKTTPAKGTPKKTVGSAKPKMLSNLNLRPPGKKALRDFVTEKKPKDNQERFAVIGVYLRDILKVDAFDRDCVLTAFREINVRPPLDIDGALRVAASRKGWLDTSDIEAVVVTMRGSNFVHHDLPPVTKAKKN